MKKKKNTEEKLKKNAKEAKKELKEKSKDNEALAKDYLDQLQRLQAEFINYRQRSEKERQDLIKFAKEDLILKLLDVLDNFERAVKAIKEADDINKCSEGVEMILNQLREILEKEGLKTIEAKGNKFNPYEHEAISKEDSEEDIDTIIEELQKGYKLKDKVIRPSKVKVSGGKKNE